MEDMIKTTETTEKTEISGAAERASVSGKPVIFAGTTEGRQMSERLSDAGIEHIVCVATAYGNSVMKAGGFADVRQGRLNVSEMEALMTNEASIVFDATHPYASEVTRNIREAAVMTKTEYVRIARKESRGSEDGSMHVFRDAASCAEALAETKGNILLTTGSKDLHVYAQDEKVRKRLFARVLPSVESITLCEAFGLKGRQIIAMQGPFSRETDLALISQFDIRTIVSKSSGSAGGYDEKLEAAAEAGTDVFVIGRPADQKGISVNEALREHFGIRPLMQVDLVGTGPGRAGLLTAEASEAVKKAELLFGAPRMIEPYKEKQAYPYYRAADIIPIISEERPDRIAVLFSGDTGFYSGAAAMKPELEKWLGDNGFEYSINIHPGISSYSYLAAAAGVSYTDAGFCSIHGKSTDEDAIARVISTVRKHHYSFILLSGSEDVRMLGGLLNENELGHCTVVLGSQLSYDDEIIAALTPERCISVVRDGLYTALVVNDNAAQQDTENTDAVIIEAAEPETAGVLNPTGRRIMPVIGDDSFVRGRMPMSKENIRHLSIVKMDLRDDSVVYDIGSGTGSVACEIAALDENIRVYAVEMKEDACALIKQNSERFGLGNIGIIYGKAPEAFAELETPTHVFIGGSSGNLARIIEALRTKAEAAGSRIRVVVNAVSLETMAAIQSLIKGSGISDVSIEQVAVSRAKEIGKYHMMTAENPVIIAAFTIGGGK